MVSKIAGRKLLCSRFASYDGTAQPCTMLTIKQRLNWEMFDRPKATGFFSAEN